MKLRIVALLIGFLAGLVGPRTVAAQERTTLLKQAGTLRCTFGAGHTFEWHDGEAVATNTEDDSPPVMFDQIDRESNRARLIGNTPVGPGTEEVAVVEFDSGPLPRLGGSSTYGLTFLSVSDAGALHMTTVWSPADPGSNPANALTYPAVWSHHWAVDKPFPSQFAGWCRIEG